MGNGTCCATLSLLPCGQTSSSFPCQCHKGSCSIMCMPCRVLGVGDCVCVCVSTFKWHRVHVCVCTYLILLTCVYVCVHVTVVHQSCADSTNLCKTSDTYLVLALSWCILSLTTQNSHNFLVVCL